MSFVKLIPMMKCDDMREALRFYTTILDFDHVGTWPSSGSPSFSLVRKGEIDIQLSTHAGDGVRGNVVFIITENIDALFEKLLTRGLNTSAKPESPVHQGPINQTWGWREFYVTDPSGNTLRFGQKL